ncbi:hypothetical protein [Haliangium sp.]|uniref:hypothetical protein n=1 Tax=Haliangium sp. TaxID=2663208 RepID=UPI003D1138AD
MDESEPGVLRVSATLAHFPALEGTLVPFDCSGTFSVSSRVDGACCEIYALAGSFDGEDSWTGTFAAQYCDSPVCGCTAGDGQSCQEMGCTDQSVQLVGTR